MKLDALLFWCDNIMLAINNVERRKKNIVFITERGLEPGLVTILIHWELSLKKAKKRVCSAQDKFYFHLMWQIRKRLSSDDLCIHLSGKSAITM